MLLNLQIDIEPHILHLAVETARQSAQRDERFLGRYSVQKLSWEPPHTAASAIQTGGGAFLAPRNLPTQGSKPYDLALVRAGGLGL